MSWLCCSQTPRRGTNIYPEPLKIRIAKFLNLFHPAIKLIVLPKKKQQYKFSRQHLRFLEYQEHIHIPIVYFKTKNPQNSVLFVYCHGSGSNLNNLYNFGYSIMGHYDISVLLYDYTGDGQSKKDFQSYQIDLKVVLAWALKQGFSLQKIIICGYSIGSYSALLLPGQMGRILISPICGLTSFIEGTSLQYQGQMFDNIQNAQKIKANFLIVHGAQQMIPYSHSQALIDSLRVRNPIQNIQLYKVQGYNHLTMPNFLLQKKAHSFVNSFVNKIKKTNNPLTKQTQTLKNQLIKIAEYIRQLQSTQNSSQN